MPATPLLPTVRLRIEHLTALDAKLKNSEIKIGHAARSAASVKNLAPTVLRSNQLSSVAGSTERDCVAVLGALTDGRTRVRRAIEKLETAERISRKPIGPVLPTAPYLEAIEMLKEVLQPVFINFINPVFQVGKKSWGVFSRLKDYSKPDRPRKFLEFTVKVLGWEKKIKFLDDFSEKIGLLKVNKLLNVPLLTKWLPVLGTAVGVVFDVSKIVKNIDKGNWRGALWHGTKIVLGVTAIAVTVIGAAVIAPVVGLSAGAVAAIGAGALVIYSAMSLLEEHKAVRNGVRWLVEKGGDAAKWAGEKASSGVSWVKNRVKRAANDVVTGVREAIKNPVIPIAPIYPRPFLPMVGQGLQVLGGAIKSAGSALENMGNNGIGNAYRLVS